MSKKFIANVIQNSTSLSGIAADAVAGDVIDDAARLIDVHLPTTDGRETLLIRYTQPDPELQLLINRLKIQLPPQPPPRITASALTHPTRRSQDLLG